MARLSSLPNRTEGVRRSSSWTRLDAISSLGSDEARYPAVSPDGHWLAFSKLQSGNWHLWLRDLHNGQTSRLTHADCNNTRANLGFGLEDAGLCQRLRASPVVYRALPSTHP